MKLFDLKLKNSCFLGEPLGFFTTISLVFSAVFSFLHVFISSDFFRCFHYWFHLLTSLFLHCCCCCCTAIATDLRELFLLSGVFFSYTLSCFYQGFPRAGSSALKVAGLPTDVQNTDLAHLYIWMTQCSATIW